MSIFIESATKDNAMRLRNLRLAALLDSPAAFGEKHADAIKKPNADWEKSLQITSWCFAVDTAEDIGLVAVDKAAADRRADCWISSWWLKPGYRGQGVVNLMNNWIDEIANQKQWQRIGLGVWPDNLRAIKAYEKLGFVKEAKLMPSRSIPDLMYQPMFRMVRGELI